MDEFTRVEIEQAIKAFKSSIGKCEKAQAKLKEGSPQKKWVDRQLEAFYVAVPLMENLLGEERYIAQRYTEPVLQNAGKTYQLLIDQCEKLLTKFKDGSPQKTLAVRRLRAYQIAVTLIMRESQVAYGNESMGQERNHF